MGSLDVDRVILSTFTPYPNTPLFEQCRAMGLIGEHFDHARFNHQSPENCFTAHIAPERFHQLVNEAVLVAARKNREPPWRFLQLLWRRVTWPLRQQGRTGFLRKPSGQN